MGIQMDNTNVTISIIVPVYQAKNTLTKCVLSCLFQKDIAPEELEVILVDDGSTDRSGEICDLYAKKADDEPWQKVGVSFLKNFGDTDFCDSALANVAQYRYFAVLPHNNHDYRYSLSKKHNDLYITVLPK